MTKYQHRETTIEAAIHEAGWWKGTSEQFRALPSEKRQEVAFKATGCLYAWATWAAPVECVHTSCQVRRGELPKIALVNRGLRAEIDNGWLRFHARTTSGRTRLAQLCRLIRKLARETGVYDVWGVAASLIVSVGVSE
jgi:hypothetical protein